MLRTLVHGSSMVGLIALFAGIDSVPLVQAQHQPNNPGVGADITDMDEAQDSELGNQEADFDVR